jgi:hypothetical protein
MQYLNDFIGKIFSPLLCSLGKGTNLTVFEKIFFICMQNLKTDLPIDEKIKTSKE